MPAKAAFTTLSQELAEVAEFISDYFRQHGYTVKAEPNELGYPYTPALCCKRGHTRVICEVTDSPSLQRTKQWTAYCKSSNRDMRMAIGVSHEVVVQKQSEFRMLGAGLYVVDGAGVVQEMIPPADQGINIALPPLDQLPQKLRKRLGPAYEQFERTQWREGFEDACQAFEVEARRYLWDGTASGRIRVIRGNAGSVALTKSQIDRLTLGQLANTFGQIQGQNHADAVIGKSLTLVNKDRVGVVHHKRKSSTETSLRKNVGRHMWTIVQAMKQIS